MSGMEVTNLDDAEIIEEAETMLGCKCKFAGNDEPHPPPGTCGAVFPAGSQSMIAGKGTGKMDCNTLLPAKDDNETFCLKGQARWLVST